MSIISVADNYPEVISYKIRADARSLYIIDLVKFCNSLYRNWMLDLEFSLNSSTVYHHYLLEFEAKKSFLEVISRLV